MAGMLSCGGLLLPPAAAAGCSSSCARPHLARAPAPLARRPWASAQQRSQGACRATEEPDAGGLDKNKGGLDEGVLQRLRAAEEEMAQLRKQLEEQQSQKVAPQGAAPVDAIDVKGRRFDGVEQRENLFSGQKSNPLSSWLSEADVEFFVGNSPPGEVVASSEQQQQDAEASATVTRRLLIAGGLSVAAVVASNIPTETLRAKPPKPLFFYIVPLLRVKDLIEDSINYITEADWPTVRTLVARVKGQPNNIRETLDNVVALLEGPAQGKVQQLASELCEYVSDIDYNTYVDSMGGRAITAAQNAEYVRFSSNAQKAAVQRLDAIFKLLPPDAVEAAVEQSKLY